LSAPVLAGLDWTVMNERIADWPAETRACVRELLEGFESGVLTATAKGGADG